MTSTALPKETRTQWMRLHDQYPCRCDPRSITGHLVRACSCFVTQKWNTAASSFGRQPLDTRSPPARHRDTNPSCLPLHSSWHPQLRRPGNRSNSQPTAARLCSTFRHGTVATREVRRLRLYYFPADAVQAAVLYTAAENRRKSQIYREIWPRRNRIDCNRT